MVRLTFSNALEPLTVALARDIETWREGDLGRLLSPLPVAVPDRLVARYLNLHIAQLLGASVNLRFPFLSGVLESCLPPSLAERLLTRERVTERLAIALGDSDLLASAEMTPARRYVETGDSQSSARRRAELALELTRLFLDYASTRPAEFRRLGELGAELEIPMWQRVLWRAVTGEGSDKRATLLELILEARDDELAPPPALFVVGGSRTAPAHRLILQRLARRTEIHIYAFSACRQYWEDIEKSPDECPPLAYWGRAGRSPVRQLSELAEFDFDTAYVEPSSDTVLARIASDVLDRRSGSAERAPLARDASVRVVAAPSIRRELENIGESIWTLARQHPDLSLSDVGVLLAGSDRDLYRAQVGSVFGSLGRLPHHISLVPLTEESRVAEAINALIELPLGSFTRPEMLRVLTHPAVTGSHPEIDPADWVRWVRDLGVFFGNDASVHHNTYIDGDIYHWDQALLRLGLGACVERDPDERPVMLANRVVLPHPQTSDRRRSAGRLALLVRSLIADVTWMREQELSLAAWTDVLWRFASAYVTAHSDRESAELGRCRAALTRIGDTSISAPVPMTTAIELARSALSTLETRRGEPLTQGVCVAPLTGPPLVPFRFVFIAGLSSGTFPSSEAPGIDARAANPKATEPSASDRDRYAFLHALFSAREAVVLSYIGRDPQSGETLPPSSVVAEMMHLGRRELIPRAAKELVVELPAWAHEDAQIEDRGVNLDGRMRMRATHLAPSTTARAAQRSSRSRRRVLESLRVKSSTKTRALLGLPAREDVHRGAAVDRELSTAELARFLDSPLDAWGRSVLGIGSPEMNASTEATEPLDLSPLDRTIMMREAVCGLAIEGTGGADLTTRVAAAADRLLLRGTGPSGQVAAWQIESARTGAQAWLEVLSSIGPLDAPTSLAVGRAREGAAVIELLPPLILGDDPFIETHGLFPLIASDGSALVYFHRSDTPPATRPARALVDHLLLAACDRSHARTVAVHLVGPKRAQTLEIDAFSRDEAAALLEELALALLREPHAYELPGSAMIANHLRGKEPTADIEHLSKRVLRDYSMSISRRPGDFELPDNLDEIVTRRYMPLLSRLRRSK